jgi:hypothetical protein
MPVLPPAPMRDARSRRGANLLIALLLAPLITVVWWFSPDPSTVPRKMGRAEESLRAQASELLQRQGGGVTPQACEYRAKGLYLVCSVEPADLQWMDESFSKSGWTEAKGHAPTRQELAYSRGRETAEVKCSATRGKPECALYLYYPR